MLMQKFKISAIDNFCIHYFFYYFVDPVEKVTLSSSNLEKSISYWRDILNLKVFDQKEKSVLLGFGEDQAKLELKNIGNFLYEKKFIIIFF